MGIMEDMLAALEVVRRQPPPPTRMRAAPDLVERWKAEGERQLGRPILPPPSHLFGIPVVTDDTLPPGQFKLVYPGDDEEDPPSGDGGTRYGGPEGVPGRSETTRQESGRGRSAP